MRLSLRLWAIRMFLGRHLGQEKHSCPRSERAFTPNSATTNTKQRAAVQELGNGAFLVAALAGLCEVTVPAAVQVDARADVLFALLADPTRHAEIFSAIEVRTNHRVGPRPHSAERPPLARR